MSETLTLTLATDDFRDGLDALRREVETLVEDDLNPLAASVEETFSALGQSIGDNLEDAAARGRLSVKGLVNDVLADLSRLAADQFVRAPLEEILGSVFGGARAGGGGVARGVPYLVGERGPELFVPAGAGNVVPQGAGPVTVNISMPSSPPGDPLGRSEGQLSGAVLRGLRKAMRNG